MAKFEFPHNPGTNREDPFADENGNNPFADEDASAGETVDPSGSGDGNVYGASDRGSAPAYRPGDYVMMLPHRGGRVLTYGVCGLSLSALSLLFGALALSGTFSDWTGFSAIPLQLIALAVAVPAWILGHQDLRAIKAGAMDDAELGRTRLGYAFGIVAVLIAVAALAMVIARMLIVAFG